MIGKKKRRKSRHTAPVKSALLDAFTERDLEVWETRSIDLQSYHDRVYYDLERQRAARYEELCAALRAAPAREVLVDRWVCDRLAVESHPVISGWQPQRNWRSL